MKATLAAGGAVDVATATNVAEKLSNIIGIVAPVASGAPAPPPGTGAAAPAPPPQPSDEDMADLRDALEDVGTAILSSAEPGAPAVVVSTDQFSMSAKVTTNVTEEPYVSTTPDGQEVEVVVTATYIPGADPNKNIGSVLTTSNAQLFPSRQAGDDEAAGGGGGRRLQEGGGAASMSQAGASVSFSLYQEGRKLEVENLDKPVQISVPVNAAARQCVERRGVATWTHGAAPSGT